MARLLSVKFMIGLSLGVLLSGCVAISPEEPSAWTEPTYERQGVYHKIQKGETLWRIAKTYHVNIDDIVKANKIPNVADIKKDHRIFIPGAEAVKHIVMDVGKDEFNWPLQGDIVNYFGDRKNGYLSSGIGIRSVEGTVVRASREGKIIFADYLTGYGYTVILNHMDGLYSVYSYNGKLLVNLGDFVFKGEKIAEVGKSRNAGFLYFEIRRDGVANNPLYYLPRL